MSTKLVTCHTCKHVKAGDVQPDLSRQLFCRRYPPTPLAISHASKQGTQVQVVNVFPVVAPDNSCGEHAPLPDRNG